MGARYLPRGIGMPVEDEQNQTVNKTWSEGQRARAQAQLPGNILDIMQGLAAAMGVEVAARCGTPMDINRKGQIAFKDMGVHTKNSNFGPHSSRIAVDPLLARFDGDHLYARDPKDYLCGTKTDLEGNVVLDETDKNYAKAQKNGVGLAHLHKNFRTILKDISSGKYTANFDPQTKMLTLEMNDLEHPLGLEPIYVVDLNKGRPQELGEDNKAINHIDDGTFGDVDLDEVAAALGINNAAELLTELGADVFDSDYPIGVIKNKAAILETAADGKQSIIDTVDIPESERKAEPVMIYTKDGGEITGDIDLTWFCAPAGMSLEFTDNMLVMGGESSIRARAQMKHSLLKLAGEYMEKPEFIEFLEAQDIRPGQLVTALSRTVVPDRGNINVVTLLYETIANHAYSAKNPGFGDIFQHGPDTGNPSHAADLEDQENLDNTL